MRSDDYWITRFSDNRLRGLLQELREAIADSEDHGQLLRLEASLRLGICNYARRRASRLKERDVVTESETPNPQQVQP